MIGTYEKTLFGTRIFEGSNQVKGGHAGAGWTKGLGSSHKEEPRRHVVNRDTRA